MEKYFEALLDRFDELHRDVQQTLDELPPEAIDWVPAPDMNSLAVLILHMTGSERYYIGDVCLGDLSFRDRNAEFRVKGMDAAALKRRLTDLAAYEKSAFEQLHVAELGQERVAPKDLRTFTVAWALNHALEHTAIHVGHIQILKQMWQLKAQPQSKPPASKA
jgi:hypothetical protein